MLFPLCESYIFISAIIPPLMSHLRSNTRNMEVKLSNQLLRFRAENIKHLNRGLVNLYRIFDSCLQTFWTNRYKMNLSVSWSLFKNIFILYIKLHKRKKRKEESSLGQFALHFILTDEEYLEQILPSLLCTLVY